VRQLLCALLLGGALGLLGCSQAALPGVGGLSGVGTVAVVRVVGFDGGPPPGGVAILDAGTQVDAQYGQTAFITSGNSDDLKGLDLIVTDPSQTRNYVPAPNPLQPLSIPVVNQPVELAPSVRYGPIRTQQPVFPAGFMDGQVRTGALLFVRGAASPNISVVGAANVPESLRQLTNGLLQQSAGLVTAISARMTTSETNVVLYYATFDGQDGTVWERVLQNPPTVSPTFSGPFPTSLTPVSDCSVPSPALPPTTLYLCPPRPVRTYQNASVSALQVLPTLATDTPLPVLGGLEGGRLGVALRLLVPPLNNASLSNAGEVRIIDPAVPADLDANGTSSDPFFRIARFFAPFDHPEPPLIVGAPAQPPLRALLTHPRAYDVVADGGTILTADGTPPVLAYEGSRLFGVVDESSCYGAVDCTGILAVDSSPVLVDGGPNSNYGLLSFDSSDCQYTADDGQTYLCPNVVGTTNRMLAVRFGRGVIQGVALESTALFPNPATSVYTVVPLLAVVTISAESLDRTAPQIFFFDALGLRVLNESPTAGILNGVTLIVGSTTLSVDGGNSGAANFVDAGVGVGLWPNTENFSITSQGEIPGLTLVQGIPYDGGIAADGGVADVWVWPVPDAGAAVAANALEVNDQVLPVNLSGTTCVINQGNGAINPFAFVTAIDDAGTSIITGPLQIPTLTGENVPADLSACPGASGYITVAGPFSADPFLVVGSTSGLLGRMQADQFVDGGLVVAPPFVVPNAISTALGHTYPRFYNPSALQGTVIQGDMVFPPGSDAGVQVLPLSLHLPVPDVAFLTTPGAFYSFAITSGYLAASLPIDTVSLGFGGLFLPGGAAQTRVIDVNGEFILDIIAYPSSNTVIDFLPSALLLNFPNSGPINVHF
jgi:hypothetical protein